MNLKINELKARLAAKKRAVEDLEEAENELMLLDDESVPFVVGECIAHLPKEEVEERLQNCKFLSCYLLLAILRILDLTRLDLILIRNTVQEDTKREQSEIQAQVEKIASQMEEYKSILYAKFGNSINLEE